MMSIDCTDSQHTEKNLDMVMYAEIVHASMSTGVDIMQ